MDSREEEIDSLAELLDNAPSSIMVNDQDGKCLYANRKTFETHQWSKEEFFTKDLHDLNAPDSRPLFRSRIEAIMRDGSANFFVDHYRKDGSIVPLEVFSKKINWKGKPAILSVATDITERKKFEEQIRNSEERLETLKNVSPDIICFKSTEGKWLRANDAFLEIYGLQCVAYEGKTDAELALQTDPLFRDSFLRCLRSDQQTWEQGIQLRTTETITDPHGNVRIFDIVKVPLYHPDGSRKGLMVYGKDFTDVKRVESALCESEQKYRQIALNTSDVIWIMDDQMKYTYVSPSIQKQRGYTQEEFLALKPELIFTPGSLKKVSDLFARSISLRKEGKLPVDFNETLELESRCKDGSICSLEVFVNLIHDDEGNIVAAHGISRDITERKRFEAVLKENESRFRSFFENSPIGILEGDFTDVKERLDKLVSAGISDVENYFRKHLGEIRAFSSAIRILDMNQTGMDIFGISAKEDIRKNLSFYFTDSSNAVFGKLLGRLSAERSTYSTEIPIRTDSGVKYLTLNVAIQPGYEQSWGRVLISFADITRKRLADERIKLLADFQSRLLKTNQLKEVHELVIDTVYNLIDDIIVFTTNIDERTGSGTLVTYTGLKIKRNHITRTLGIDPMEMKFYVKDMTPEELRSFRSGKFEDFQGGLHAIAMRRFPKVVMVGIEKMLRINKIYTIGFIFQQVHLGGLIILSRTDLSAYAETVEMLVGQAAVSMNRIKAETSLKEVEERFRMAFKTSPDAININEMESGMYIDVNEGFCNLTGFRMKEVIGKTSLETDIWVDPEDRKRLVEQLKRLGKVQNFQALFRNKSGVVHAGLMSASIIHLNGIAHIISVTRDIEELKQAEREILCAKEAAEEASRLKTAFLNNISHEVRTPMNAILGFTELMQSDSITVSDKVRFSGIINSNTKQLLSIIDDVLEISRMDSGRIPYNESRFSLSALMEDIHLSMVDIVTRKKLQFRVISESGTGSDEILADREKIRQVLVGLIGNAVKFTNEGSVICGYTKRKDTIDFFVHDTGIGIAPEECEKIFERFYQVGHESSQGLHGTGLGLSIAQGLAEVMGGTIHVRSTLGAGSEFTLTVPCHEPEGAVPPAKHEKQVLLTDMTILIAEDEDNNYELLEILLAKISKKLIRAANGKDVLAILEKVKPDLILMDLKMPVMEGYEAARKAKLRYPDLCIIALTAYTQPEEERRAIESGCCAFISKPVRKQDLLETIHRCLRLES